MLKEGHAKFWGSFYIVALRFSHIDGEGGGGTESFHSLRKKGAGGEK